MFPFLLCFLLLFVFWLFVRLPHKTILLFCISFSWGWFDHCLLYNVKNLHSFSGTLSIRSNSLNLLVHMHSVQLVSSVTQLCLTLCDPMNHSTLGLPVHHQLPEFTQTHVHLVGDATQPSHPLLSPSPPAPNPSNHQGLFQ